jgi:M6 family metalloprotease-like protein
MVKFLSILIVGMITSLVVTPQSHLNGFTGATYFQARQLEGYRTAMPSTGNVNMLVIPIQFSDATCELIPEGCQTTLENIDQAFFGQPQSMRWHSVASYYHASSYGKLSISGMVTNWYTPDITAVALSNNRSLLNSQVINPAIEAFTNANPQRIRDFDADGDGYLDAVYFIYSLTFNPDGPEYGTQKDVFWAFVSYQGAVSNVNRPSLFHYAWSSYDFMYQDGYYQRSENGKVEWGEDNEPIFFPWLDALGNRTVDAHVYIHETGHLFGLQDYYTYDQSKGDWGAVGALDMMDYNVGDHHGFSKSLLGWVSPTVITTSQTIVLAPLSQQAQVLLIASQHPTTLLNEYLLVEYYRPENLNFKDSQESYAGRYPRMFSQPGIKIYHVDARLGRWLVNQGQATFDRYVTTITLENQYRHRIASTNTASRSYNPNHKLIHLLESSGVNTFRHRGFATNTTLFQTGMTFPVEANFILNSGQTFPFIISIGGFTETGATIQVQRLT